MNGSNKSELLIGWFKDWVAQVDWLPTLIGFAVFVLLLTFGYSMGRESAKKGETLIKGLIKRPLSFHSGSRGGYGRKQFRYVCD